MSTMETTLGIRLRRFLPAAPKQGDSVLIGGADLQLARPVLPDRPRLTTIGGATWFVWDVNPDGQGGASLVIKQQRPLE